LLTKNLDAMVKTLQDNGAKLIEGATKQWGEVAVKREKLSDEMNDLM
jgi:hypothetical protein